MWEPRWCTDVASYSNDSHGSQTGQRDENFNKVTVIFISEIMEDITSMKQEWDCLKKFSEG